ncbi:hypothetical protein NF212_15010 [Parasalinivibrio latis]|uniref:hypothetical protein n=1 Tax=Parasalinivibrio latis TaxID=2952610 RepID=UPI0030E31CA3
MATVVSYVEYHIAFTRYYENLGSERFQELSETRILNTVMAYKGLGEKLLQAGEAVEDIEAIKLFRLENDLPREEQAKDTGEASGD